MNTPYFDKIISVCIIKLSYHIKTLIISGQPVAINLRLTFNDPASSLECFYMVPGKRLELLSLSALASKTSVYTNSTTQAKLYYSNSITEILFTVNLVTICIGICITNYIKKRYLKSFCHTITLCL
jgi:hypothetical protein